jgi:iron-sulfur cluster repair protein YtfE (RIC family)
MLNQSNAIPRPSTVRGEVLGQHEAVRDLLQRVIAEATLVLRPPQGQARVGHAGGGEEVSRMAYELRQRFRSHLAFEERLLLPVLASADVWGPERARNLMEEHARQREELDELVQGLEAGWEKPRVARALRALATDLLRDMQEEERDYLHPDILRDDVITLEAD